MKTNHFSEHAIGFIDSEEKLYLGRSNNWRKFHGYPMRRRNKLHKNRR